MAEGLTWRNIDMVEIPGKGQGLIAITPFQKKIVVDDCHGEEMVHSKGVSLDHFCAENPDKWKQDFCIEMKNGKRRIIDAMFEPCSQHPGRSCFGRLCNHACAKRKEKATQNAFFVLSICVATSFILFGDLNTVVNGGE